ncbi:MAG: helix-turn-helix domain-containing protein [Candidatus Woesearchaeota archaeon]
MIERTQFNRWTCPTQKTVELIGDKWTLFIIREFIFGKQTMRFNEILRKLKPISSRTLALKLDKLQKCEILTREVLQKKPLQVHYKITRIGLELKDSMLALADWHNKYKLS